MAHYNISDFEAKKAYEVEARKTWTWKDYHKRDGKALQNMKVNNPKRFIKLFTDQYGKAPRI